MVDGPLGTNARPINAPHRHSEKKSSSLSYFRFHPNPPAVTLYDSLADGQPESSPRIVSAVQPFEKAKDLLVVLHRYAKPIVFDRDEPGLAQSLGCDTDKRRLGASILNSV